MTYRLEEKVVNSLARQTGVDFFDTHFTRDNPYEGQKRGQQKNMMLNWVKMQKMSRDYDKVWIVESDTVPPIDGLSKLLKVDAPVVTGLYASRHEPFSPNLLRKDNCPGVGAVMTWAEVIKDWGNIVEVSGGCTGCLLIDRSVLDAFEYSEDDFIEHLNSSSSFPDLPFMEFCWKNGFKQMARLDVICDHVRPDGMIVRPTIDGPKLSKAA